MANENKDVLRVFDSEENLSSVVRNRQIGFATNSPYKMLRKDSVGNQVWYTSDTGNREQAGTITAASTSGPQFVSKYDASNYSSFQTNSSGDLTITPTGENTSVVGDMSVNGTLTLNPGAQAYKIGNRGSTLYFQSQTNDTSSTLELFSKRGDGGDSVGLTLWGYGAPDSVDDRHRMLNEYYASGNYYRSYIDHAGTQTAKEYRLFTNDHVEQLVLKPDGSVSMSGPLTVSGQIGRVITADNQIALKVAGGDYDSEIWRINAQSDLTTTPSTLGYYLRYTGTGSGNDNGLELWANNEASSDKRVYRILQDGTINYDQAVSMSGALDVGGNVSQNKYSSDALSNSYTMFKARGTSASPSSVSVGDSLGALKWQAYYSGAAAERAAIEVVEAQDGSTNRLSQMLFKVRRYNGIMTSALSIKYDDISKGTGVGVFTNSPKATFHVTNPDYSYLPTFTHSPLAAFSQDFAATVYVGSRSDYAGFVFDAAGNKGIGYDTAGHIHIGQNGLDDNTPNFKVASDGKLHSHTDHRFYANAKFSGTVEFDNAQAGSTTGSGYRLPVTTPHGTKYIQLYNTAV